VVVFVQFECHNVSVAPIFRKENWPTIVQPPKADSRLRR
jgi:hypothetical protein